MGYRLNTAKTGSATYQIIYSKGAAILHMLRMMMWDPKTGDQRFSAMMRDFVQTHFNQNVSTDDFKRAVEKHMIPELNLAGNGRMDWFFDQWVYGTALPDYKLEYRLEPADGGKTRLLCKVTQSQVDSDFVMRVPIYIDFDGGVRRLGTVVLNGNSTSPEIDVMLPKKPKTGAVVRFRRRALHYGRAEGQPHSPRSLAGRPGGDPAAGVVVLGAPHAGGMR